MCARLKGKLSCMLYDLNVDGGGASQTLGGTEATDKYVGITAQINADRQLRLARVLGCQPPCYDEAKGIHELAKSLV